MARYETVVETTMSAEEAFTYMSDLCNFEEWDPGVKSSTQIAGDGPGLGATYDVELSAMTLQYETTTYEPPFRAEVEAHSKLLSSYDTIVVEGTDAGASVRYIAAVELQGALKLLDPVFGLVFDRIGDKAAAGLEQALDGTKVG